MTPPLYFVNWFVRTYFVQQLSRFFIVNVPPHSVMVRRSDFRIRVIDIVRASDRSPYQVTKIMREFRGSSDLVHDHNHSGNYVDFWVGLELCQRYDLNELGKELLACKGIPQEPAKAPAKELVKESVEGPEISEFFEITGFSSPVMVRNSDFRINAWHIVRLTGHSRNKLSGLKERLSLRDYDVVRGIGKQQGTYVNLDVGIELCRQCGLFELEKRLYNLISTSQGPVLEAESIHDRLQSQTFRQLPEPPEPVLEKSPQRDNSTTPETEPASSACSSMRLNDGDEEKEITDNSEDESLQGSVHDPDSRLAKDTERNSPAANASQRWSWASQSEKSRLSQVHLKLNCPSEVSWQYGNGLDMSHSFFKKMQYDD